MGEGVPNGANATSYKAAVTHGNMTQEDRRDGHQGRPQENRGGDKGKGIARDRQMSYKQEGPYHPYRERFSKNYEEGSSVNGRKSGYGDWRNGVQSRGYQQPRSEDVEHHSIDHPKLMADAFKGVSRSPGRDVPRVPTMDATESSKTRKALLFDEPVVENQVEAPAQVVNASNEEQSGEKQAKSVEETKVEDEALHSQALDDANLMVEGVILSDFELLLEDGEEGEEWEHGEIMDFTEEEGLNVEKQELADQGDSSVQPSEEV